ncbi:MAG: metallophosphoesterase [Thermoguttaceae bacterium]|nr:metallophosphoesterase [Thermoguttaceae bacterium]
MSISRRNFLRSALAAICLPAGLVQRVKAETNKSVVLRFAAMSDVHFNKDHTPESPQRIRLAKAIQTMYSYSAQQAYPNFDALAVAGDFSDHGIAEELYPFRDILDREMKPETTRVLCMGNHEHYGGNREFFEETFGTKANNHYVINGYHFITIAPETGKCDEDQYLYIRDWLDAELKKAHEADPNRPIFVVQHYNVYNTIWGSADYPNEFHAGVKDLLGVIDQYPHVVHISGHSHAPSFHPRSMWQGTFNAVGTGSMSYFGNYPEGLGKMRAADGVDRHQAGTFLIFEVYEDQSILIKLYDTISDSFLDREYLLIDPRDPETYTYTDKRLDDAPAPAWPDGARLEVAETTAETAAINIPAALDDYCVTFYTVTLEKENPEEGEKPRVVRFWSDYFMKNHAEQLKAVIDKLAAGTTYRVTVVGTNAFKKETPTALTGQFTTAEN